MQGVLSSASSYGLAKSGGREGGREGGGRERDREKDKETKGEAEGAGQKENEITDSVGTRESELEVAGELGTGPKLMRQRACARHTPLTSVLDRDANCPCYLWEPSLGTPAPE